MELESHLLHLSVPKAVAYLIDLPDRTHLPTSKSCFSQWYHYEDTVNIPRKPKGNNTYIWQVIQNKDGENKIIQTGESEFPEAPWGIKLRWRKREIPKELRQPTQPKLKWFLEIF